jgi:hypothetical protein
MNRILLRWALVAAISGSAPYAGAVELAPTPQDPVMADLYARAQTLLAKAGDPGMLEMPAQASPWPCAVTELELRRYAGVLNPDELPASARKVLRAGRANLGMSIKTLHKDVAIAPVSGQCKDGVLDGPVVYLIEYTSVTETPVTLEERRSRSWIATQVAKGEIVPESYLLSVMKSLGARVTHKDPAVQAQMKSVATPEVKSLTVLVRRVHDLETNRLAMIQELQIGDAPKQWSTMFTVPQGNQKVESTMYSGSKLQSITRMKAGVLHGETRTMPMTYGTVTVPGSTTCYDEGEILRTARCDVD